MAPLRHRPFALLVVGQLVSNLGDAIYSVALAWYILADHGGALLLGAVLTAYGVPRLALLLVGGHASDRFSPWTVMLIANVTRGLAVTALAITAATSAHRGPLIFVIAIVLGAGEGLFIPAASAIVPALLAADELQAGNAVSFGVTQLAQLAGPALGGVLVAVIGSATAFGIDTVTFLISAVTLIGIARQPPRVARTPGAAPDREHAAADESLRAVLAGAPVLRVILITDAVLNLGSAGLGRVALPALARGPLHLHAGGYGVLAAAMGAGLLLGTIAGARLAPARRPLRIASLTLLPTVPLIAAVPYSGGLIAAAILLIAAFALISVSNLLLLTGEQRWAPAHLRGRIAALLMLSSVGMLPVSVLLAGAAIHVVGTALYFPLDAGTVLLAALAQLSSPSWRAFDPTRAPRRVTRGG